MRAHTHLHVEWRCRSSTRAQRSVPSSAHVDVRRHVEQMRRVQPKTPQHVSSGGGIGYPRVGGLKQMDPEVERACNGPYTRMSARERVGSARAGKKGAAWSERAGTGYYAGGGLQGD